MARGEISWKRRSADGLPVQVYAHPKGDRWCFFVRERRFDRWLSLDDPPLGDWLTLLDAVERRIQRRLLPPEEADRLRKTIRDQFPEVKLPGYEG